ncbi:hypothetical protein HPB47_008923 [Ixodes persulcatus]|uniref:Uncharacterized protein n=1 Tax=Ixodes persulcatus TaxID=34615 RepID=A0AC60P3D2_IXOPE|nr:hypothetical protein HPB47_008923 [Ixodes persulcatus]
MSLPGPPTAKRKVLSLKVKRTILEDILLGLKKSVITKKYEVSPSTLSTITRNADKIDAALDNDAACANRKKLRKTMCEDGEAALFKWFLDARVKGVPINGPILIDKARNLRFIFGHDLSPGTGWLQRFKDRHSITCKSIVGKAPSVDDTVLQAWLDKHLEQIFAT